MTLGTLMLGVGAVALVLTALMYFLKDKEWIQFKSLPMSYVQNFVGSLYIFSGFVKAVDPLGTAYKLEQYFAEFEKTFEPTWFGFMSDLFPLMAEAALPLAVFVIIFEIALGVFLLTGAAKKFTGWAFLLLIIFFTFLTGFTYLTGYVPTEPIVEIAKEGSEGMKMLEGEAQDSLANGWKVENSTNPNFFKFNTWGEWVETNMKVTDCGCFGDFLKLEPRTSFLKDVFLLLPGILFLLFSKNMHTLFSARTRKIVNWSVIGGFLALSIYSFAINLPLLDFRPFKNGTDVRAQKQLEMDYESSATISAFLYKNENTNKVVEIPMATYSTDIKSYPKEDGWALKKQIKSTMSYKVKNTKTGEEAEVFKGTYERDPSQYSAEAGWDWANATLSEATYEVPHTKISEYSIQGSNSVTYVDMVTPDGDTIPGFAAADLAGFDTTGYQILKTYQEVEEGIDIEQTLMADQNYSFMIVAYKVEKSNASAFAKKVKALHAGAEGDGYNFYAVTGSADESVENFRHDNQLPFTFYSADDILLKTIVRSNPGVVLWKDGKIIKKWHHRQLPSYEAIKAQYMK